MLTKQWLVGIVARLLELAAGGLQRLTGVTGMGAAEDVGLPCFIGLARVVSRNDDADSAQNDVDVDGALRWRWHLAMLHAPCPPHLQGRGVAAACPSDWLD